MWLPRSWSVFIALVLAYGAMHAAIHLITAPAIGVDHDLEVLRSQSWAWGYSASQPPLFTWVTAALFAVTGPALWPLLAFKYLCLTASLALAAAIGTRLLGDRVWGFAAATSLLLLYQIGWNFHEGVTHTQLLLLFCLMTAWAWLRLADGGGWRDAVLLGVAIGGGLLSKYGYLAFLVCLLGATALQGAGRGLPVWRALPVALGLAVVIAGPFLVWIVADGGVAGVYRATMTAGAESWLGGVALGLASALVNVLGFLSPLVLVVLICVPAALWVPRPEPVGFDAVRLARDASLIGCGLLLAGVVVAGVDTVKARWLHPLLILAPFWLLARLSAAQPSQRRLAALAGLFLVLTASVVALRLATNLVAAAPFCHSCRLLQPYAGLADAIRESGFTGGPIAAADTITAANLRLAFPQSIVTTARVPQPVAAPCLWVGSGPAPDGRYRTVAVPWPHHPNRETLWHIGVTTQGPCAPQH